VIGCLAHCAFAENDISSCRVDLLGASPCLGCIFLPDTAKIVILGAVVKRAFFSHLCPYFPIRLTEMGESLQ
jgi:hypothetical protein